MPAGRPSDYSEGLADIICERISDGESLRSICSAEDMPNKSTVFRWLASNEEFATRYAHARDVQTDVMVDEMTDIADDGSNDWMERKDDDGNNIGWRENGEALRRSALRISTRQWIAEKLKPKKYGDRLDLNHSGSIERLSDEQLDAKLAELLGKAGAAAAGGGEGSPS